MQMHDQYKANMNPLNIIYGTAASLPVFFVSGDLVLIQEMRKRAGITSTSGRLIRHWFPQDFPIVFQFMSKIRSEQQIIISE